MKKTIPLTLVLAAALAAQVAQRANQGYQTKQDRERMVRTLEDPKRDARQKPKELVAAMELKPGMTVADIGAGPGYMLPWLGAAVGAAGRVLAEDIHSDFLDEARKNAQRASLKNVTFILGGDTDPLLPEGQVDAILMLDVYHHFDYPGKMLARLRAALKHDGRLFLVDYYKRPGAMPGGFAVQHIRLDAADAIKEIESFGFRLVTEHEHIPHSQYMAVFEKRHGPVLH